MLTTRIIHIYRVFLLSKGCNCMAKMDALRSLSSRKILLFNVMGLIICTGFEDGCYEHITLAKSGEDNQ